MTSAAAPAPPAVFMIKGNYGLAGGPETLIASIARHLDPCRFSPVLIVLRRDGVPESPQLNSEALPIERIDLRWPGLAFALQTAMRLKRVVAQRRIAVLHTHDMRANLVAWLVTRVYRAPWIAHVHGWLGPTQTGKWRLYEKLDARLVQAADVVLVGSAAARQDVERAGVTRVRVLPNGIEVPHDGSWNGTGDEVRRRLGIGPDTLTVGIVGRVHRGKGHRFLLDAIAQVRARGRDIRGIIVGEGPDLESLRAFAAELGIVEAVHFAGFCSNSGPYLSTMDIFVAPSLKESLPLTVLEAMAIRRPVIATRVGDIGAVIEDGENGFLVPPGEPEPIARAIERLAADADLRLRIGQCARATVVQRFSAETMARGLESVYSSVLGRQSAAV